jgi:hypothetical protein
MRIPTGHYNELRELSARNGTVPDWLSSATESGWGMDLSGLQLNEAVKIREPGLLGTGGQHGNSTSAATTTASTATSA